jgi:hypothetical protein
MKLVTLGAVHTHTHTHTILLANKIKNKYKERIAIKPLLVLII